MPLLTLLKAITNHPANRDQKFATILRFVRWQVRSRLASGPIVHPWVNGSRFFVRNGETGLTGNIYSGLHEFTDMAYLLHVLRPEDLFIDIGANVGAYTILAGAAVGARCVAFEPVPSTYARLSENIRINRMGDRVEAKKLGIAQKRDVIRFTSGLDTTNHAVASDERADDVVEIETVPLDEAIPGASPALIKIDVEGYETLVLEGAPETLGNPALHSIIIELNGSGQRYGFDEQKIVDLLRQAGFLPFSYDPLTRNLARLQAPHRTGNTIFVRNEDLVRQRLASAPKYAVHGKSL